MQKRLTERQMEVCRIGYALMSALNAKVAKYNTNICLFSSSTIAVKSKFSPLK